MLQSKGQIQEIKIMEKNKKHLSGSEKTRPGITRTSLSLAILITALLLTLSSCRKKEKEEVVEEEDTEQSTANDNNVAESYMADIESMGGQVADEGSLETYRTSGGLGIEALEAAGCAVVTIGGQTVTVDFGNGCVGKDGRTRSGKLLFDFSGSAPGANYYRNPGFSMKVTSQNYSVDSHTVTLINKTITNITPNTIPAGLNPGTNLKWSVVANVSITKPNGGGVVTWSCNRTKELTNTADTNCYKGQGRHIVWTRAMVKLNGSASGVNAKGENFTAVATDVVRDFQCAPDPVQRPHRHPCISGTVVYTPGNRPMRTIDYGNGACDMNATLTIKGHVYNVTLP